MSGDSGTMAGWEVCQNGAPDKSGHMTPRGGADTASDDTV